MPKIEELNIGQVGLRPSEVGVEAQAGAARRIGMFSNQTAAAREQTGHLLGRGLAAAGDAAVAIEDHREISTGAAKGVEMFANLIDSKDQAIKAIDPNDPAYGQKVKAAVAQWQEQTVEPALQQFQQGFNTQKSQDWAEHFIDQTRTHMSREGISDVANAAALGVKNTVTTTVNQASNLVVQNPSSLDAMLDLVEHSVGGIADSSPIKGVAAAEMKTKLVDQAKEKLVKDAALGAILKSSDPEATAADFVKRYPKYINGAEALQLGRAAKAQNKQNGLTDYAAQEHERALKIQQGTQELGQIYANNVTRDETGKPTINPDLFKQTTELALKNPDVAEHVRVQQDWAEHQLTAKKETWNSDPATLQKLYDGLFDQTKPVTDVDLMRANIDRKLSDQDHARLENLRKMLEKQPLHDPIYTTTMDSVKGILGNTPPGHERYAQFVQQFIPAFLALPVDQRPGALNIKDPNSLLSKTMDPIKPAPFQIMMERATHGDIDPDIARKIMESGGTIGGVKPTEIRTGGQTVTAPPKVDKAGYDALPSGAKFTAPDGSVRVKP